jgi:enamine deaminase RidA (YjgF/YER057c/UK114 family)
MMPRSEKLRLGAGLSWYALVGLAALALSGRADAQARTEATVLISNNERARADQEQYGYADAVIAGDLIFLSGIVAGKAPSETDLTPAFERAFRNIGRILERAGVGYGDIVDITSFHTDITTEIEVMSDVSKRLLGSPPPAWTAVQVERLLPDQGIAEIKIVARRTAAAKAQ